MNSGVIFYGPPASGKDTIDAALCVLDTRFRHFERLKVGSGKVSGYRITTSSVVQSLRETGEVIWENSRYGATYVVDRPGLVEALERAIPVLHLGQPEAIEAVRSATPAVHWTVVELTTPRDVAIERFDQRNPHDAADRLKAWDETPPLKNASLRIDTSKTSVEEAANQIHTEAVRRAALPN